MLTSAHPHSNAATVPANAWRLNLQLIESFMVHL